MLIFFPCLHWPFPWEHVFLVFHCLIFLLLCEHGQFTLKPIAKGSFWFNHLITDSLLMELLRKWGLDYQKVNFREMQFHSEHLGSSLAQVPCGKAEFAQFEWMCSWTSPHCSKHRVSSYRVLSFALVDGVHFCFERLHISLCLAGLKSSTSWQAVIKYYLKTWLEQTHSPNQEHSTVLGGTQQLLNSPCQKMAP